MRPVIPEPPLVRAELERLLASAEFRTSRRCQEFLRYVVETTLDGHAETLKERTIAMEVFGKDPSREAGEDAAVRVKAGDVRKRLARCYASSPAPQGLVIDLPLGTYVPEFRTVEPPVTMLPRPRRWPRVLAVAVLAGVGVAAGVAQWRREPAVLDAFWGPMLEGRAPVPVCLSLIPVYSLKVDPPPAGAVARDNLISVPDEFLAAGDLRAAREIGEMLEGRRRPYRLRIGGELSFRELRSAPAVLVGFSYSEWEEISRSFRFFLDTDRDPFAVRDGGNVRWQLSRHPDDPALAEDYALVSRVFDGETRTFLIEVSGLAHYGTEAAAELVTSPALLAEALRSAPADWSRKNLQLVVRTRVVNKAAGAPEVLAAHFW
jgi:hypothetical protein